MFNLIKAAVKYGAIGKLIIDTIEFFNTEAHARGIFQPLTVESVTPVVAAE